jgi:protein-S-isoprenylcysteine O-methyltransferase Ste14
MTPQPLLAASRSKGAVAKTLIFTLLVPGSVAGIVPWWLRHDSAIAISGPQECFAVVLICIGSAIYLCTALWSFAWVAGGTPAPFAPPRILVVRGLHRFVRNPMYIGVGCIIRGQAWLFHSLPSTAYLVLWLLVVHLFVVFYEEPTLQKQFGEEYQHYLATVPRWLPKIKL